jgi:hypothetical protein
MVTFLNFDINDILFERQHKASITFRQEINFSNLIRFIVNILLDRNVHLLQQWTDPANEAVRLELEIVNGFIGILVEMHNSFDLQTKWKTVQEVLCLMESLFVIEVLNLCHQLGV